MAVHVAAVQDKLCDAREAQLTGAVQRDAYFQQRSLGGSRQRQVHFA